MNRNKIADIYKEDDNIYLNITFEPDYSVNGPVALEYDVTKDVPIVDNGSEYYCSIIRFDLPLAEIPVTLPPIVPNQSNPNLTPLVIGISYNGVDYPQHVIFETQLSAIPPPAQNMPYTVYTDYYNIYEYQWMIKLINTALLASFNLSPLPGLFGGYVPPYYNFNETTQLIELIIPKYFHTLTAPAVAIPTININYSFYQFLENFTYVGLSYGPTEINNFNAYLDTSYLNDINGYALYGTAPTSPPTYYILQQSAFSMQYWNPVKKILFTSDSIPIRKEFVQINQSSGLAPSLPIITDFTPTVENSTASRSIAYYFPTAQYRLADILTNGPVQKISLKVYWEDLYGNINPMTIGSYQQANVKMAFLRKSLYKHKLT